MAGNRGIAEGYYTGRNVLKAYSHEQLLKKKGVYAALYYSQFA